MTDGPCRGAGPVLMLWSVPRGRSTAFFRMMVERGDVTGVHEPFSYLAEFGTVQVGGQWVTTPAGLLAELRELGRRGPVFAKETTGRRYPEVLADEAFLARDARHAFLIRHPRETIASRAALQAGAPRERFGFESLYEVYTAVARLAGREPVVIDAADLMARPAAVVRAYCERSGIEFVPAALNWPAGDRPEWARSRPWHAEVAASAGLGDVPPAPGRAVNPATDPVLREHLAYHLPFYQELHARRLRVAEDAD
jgi:Sulfotransferase domain